jgi:hypothetical protein
VFVKDAAVISGYSARLVGVALRDLARKGYFDAVAPSARTELLDLIAEIEKAGRAWQISLNEQAGNAETPQPEIAAQSVMTAEQASTFLGLTARRVRQLAPVIGGHKHRGRWTFDRAAVLAEKERRTEVA